MQSNFKRMVILSDLHCGHELGLTPPSWQYQTNNSELGDVAKLQQQCWNWYKQQIDIVGKDVDVLVINGDLIDGRGEKSGSTELITSDRTKQGIIATECIQEWNCDNIFITRGTPYHSGSAEQFEDMIAERLNANIDNVIELKVNNRIFNFRHKVGGSSVPYGKTSPVVKEAVWNLINASYNEVKSADVVVRSHVHYMIINQDSMRYSITTPALQLNSRYGQQQCTGHTDFGFIVIDIYDDGEIKIKPYIYKPVYESKVITVN